MRKVVYDFRLHIYAQANNRILTLIQAIFEVTGIIKKSFVNVYKRIIAPKNGYKHLASDSGENVISTLGQINFQIKILLS